MTKELDPQFVELLRAADEAGIPPIHSMSYKQAREFYTSTSKRLSGESPNNLQVTNQIIETGEYPIPIRLYRPEAASDTILPGLVYLHGGGWCTGDLESHDHVCRWLASHAECVVIAVDYRLGPEHKFPAAVDDAYAATKWICIHASDLMLDPQKIAIGGDSAGGNLSAVVSLLAREQGGPDLSSQLLIYPATDMLMRYPSHLLCGDGYRLTRTAIAWFLNGYLRDGEDMYDLRASPLMAKNHNDLPPAFVMTAGFDPLKDEGEAYANKLKEAGVEVKYQCYEGMLHGFIAMPGVIDVARAALLDAAGYLKETFSA